MSATIAKRKRARKACIPCHQRKRKCDTMHPCDMCTTYGYNCRYTGDNITDTAGGSAPVPPPAKQVRLDDESRLTGRAATGRQKGGGFSVKSPTVVAGVSPGLFDEQKFRYCGASAVMAFPHILGAALGSDSPPKMRPFAYNFGIRPEEASNAHCFLGSLISEEELEAFSGTFFQVLGPIGDVIDPRIYAQRCWDYYHHSDSSSTIAFAAVAAGVAALGSFLSPSRHRRESDLVQYAKAILDDPASMRSHGIDHIVAWGMRVFYLRATTRPSNAWIASCTQMHLCEALGLHEEDTIQKIASVAGAAVVGHDADRLRRIFWISWAGHNMLSYEYDRSPVGFRAVTCQPIISTPGSVADQFVQLIQIIPSPNSPFQLDVQPPNPSGDLFQRLQALDDLQFTHPFLVVTKADISFCFYRRLHQLKIRIPDDILKLIIDSGNAAVEAGVQEAGQGRLFWNVIGSVFQYTCILLAIDTPAASPHIGAAFKGLENLVKAADTALTREALSVARHLLSLTMAKKRKELAHMEAVEAGYELFQAPPVSEANAAVPEMNWEVDWDQFFIEPYSSIFGPDVHL